MNFQKSGFFSSNVSKELRRCISTQLGVSAPLNTGRCLGLPSLIGRKKRAIIAYSEVGGPSYARVLHEFILTPSLPLSGT